MRGYRRSQVCSAVASTPYITVPPKALKASVLSSAPGVGNTVAHTSASWLSGGLFQRRI